jgi:hypothetical protein
MNSEIKNMDDVCEIFDDAKEFDAKYIGVLISMEGFEKPEVIINGTENFNKKLKYYIDTYNYHLQHKHANVKIIDVTYGNTFTEIEKGLGV